MKTPQNARRLGPLGRRGLPWLPGPILPVWGETVWQRAWDATVSRLGRTRTMECILTSSDPSGSPECVGSATGSLDKAKDGSEVSAS